MRGSFKECWAVSERIKTIKLKFLFRRKTEDRTHNILFVRQVTLSLIFYNAPCLHHSRLHVPRQIYIYIHVKEQVIQVADREREIDRSPTVRALPCASSGNRDDDDEKMGGWQTYTATSTQNVCIHIRRQSNGQGALTHATTPENDTMQGGVKSSLGAPAEARR